MCIRMPTDPHTHVKKSIVHVRVRWIVVCQSNPACAANVSLHNVEVGHSTKEEKEGVTGFWSAEFTGRNRIQYCSAKINSPDWPVLQATFSLRKFRFPSSAVYTMMVMNTVPLFRKLLMKVYGSKDPCRIICIHA